MTPHALIEAPAPAETADALESRILEHIDEQAVASLDTLIALMPQYSWNQIFHTVDCLARCGKIVLRRHGFDYTVFSPHYAA